MDTALQSLFAALRSVVCEAVLTVEDADDFAHVPDRLHGVQSTAGSHRSAEAVGIGPALTEALGDESADPTLVGCLADARPYLHWVQAYSHLPSSPNLESFRSRYAYLVIAGPEVEGAAPPVVLDDMFLGLTVQAPNVLYPHHFHDPPELYGVISGEIDWQIEDRPWQTRRPGDTIVHRSGESHSMITTATAGLTWVMWPRDPHAEVIMPSLETP